MVKHRNKSRATRRRDRNALSTVVGVRCAAYCVWALALWVVQGIEPATTVAQTAVDERVAGDKKATSEASSRSSLLRDEDLERQLAEADRRMASGEWELAATLLQRVLDEGRATLIPIASEAGRSGSARAWMNAGKAVERRLARFPEDALRRYRLVVDGQARAELGGPLEEASLKQLREVARRYRYSSLGDRVLWETARRSLDQLDFVASLECCEVLAQRPLPPGVTRDAMARVAAVAAAYVGDRAAAERWLPDCRDEQVVTTVRRALETQPLALAHDDDLARSPHGAVKWEAVWRSPSSTDGGESKVMTLSPFSWTEPEPGELPPESGLGRGLLLGILPWDDRAASRHGYDELLPRMEIPDSGDRWWGRSGIPVRAFWCGGNVLIGRYSESLMMQTLRIDGDSVLGASENASNWKVDHDWSALLVEDPTRIAAFRGVENSTSDRIRWFDWMSFAFDADGDRVAILEKETHRADGVSERSTSDRNGEADALPGAEPFSLSAKLPRRAWSPRVRRSQSIALRDARSGGYIWRHDLARLPKRSYTMSSENDSAIPPRTSGDSRAAISAIGPPLLEHERVYLPLLRDATLSVVALDSANGEVEWETAIGGEAPDARKEIPVTLAADHGHVYAALGNGSCVALDAHTGALEWGETYERTSSGWSEDRVGIVGRWLVRISSDDDRLWVYDRRSGRRVWGTPGRLPDGSRVDRLVGVRGGRLLVAGRTELRAYDLESGVLQWQTTLPPRLGDPLLLEHCVLVPVGDFNGEQPAENSLLIERRYDGGWRRAGVVSLEIADGRITNRAEWAEWANVPTPPLTLIAGPTGLYYANSESVSELRHSFRSRQPIAPLTFPPLAYCAQHPKLLANVDANALVKARWKEGESWRCVVTDLKSGLVRELDASGNPIWERVTDGLPGLVAAMGDQRRWVLDHSRNEIVEFSAVGQVLERWSELPGRPASFAAVERGRWQQADLPSVVMTFPETGIVACVNGEGKWIWQFVVPGRPVDARLVGIDRVWVALADLRQIRELNLQGETLRTIWLDDRPRWLQPSGVDSLLVTVPDRFQVVSRTWNAKDELLQRSGTRGFRGAWQVADGEWLVVDETSYALVSSDGKTRWKKEDVLVGGISVLKP